MANLDTLLARLAQEPGPPQLDQLDAHIAAAIDAAAQTHSRRLGLVAVAAAAVTLGVIGGGLAPQPTQAQTFLAPFGPSTPLTPATLLAGVG